jgi:hypothetical protein
VHFRPSHAETGLRQILPHRLPTWRLSAGNVNVVQYEGPDVIERPEHAFAARRAYIHPDRLKNKLAHGMQTPANPLGFPKALRSKERTRLDGRLDKKKPPLS